MIINNKALKDGNNELRWNGDSFPAKVLLAFCRRTPHFRGKGRLFSLASNLFHRGEIPLVSNWGAHLIIDASDFIGRTMAFKGGFETDSLRLARRLMIGGGVFVDVGCNFGLYTISMGKIPGVKCIAIDGSFVALTKIQKNLAKNPSVVATIVNSALVERAGLQCFEVPSDRNLGGTRVVQDGVGALSSSFWTAGLELNTILAKLKIDGIRLLKIDVEGFELSVFKGLDFEGPFRPENLIMECDLELFPEALRSIEYLKERGYEALEIGGEPAKNFKKLAENNVWLRDSRSPKVRPM